MISSIICCDWGTTSLRIKIFDASSMNLLTEQSSAEGAAKVFSSWQYANKNVPVSRTDYYLAYLNDRIQQMVARTEINPAEATILISGMASSSIGMLELPYASVPFGLDGRDAVIKRIENDRINGRVYLISGASNGKDVMRGEETQLIGLSVLNPALFAEDAICILPGTHSKHVYVSSGAIVSFKTYVTGEMFSLLNEHSILKTSDHVKVDMGELSGADIAPFSAGVQRSQCDSLLHSLFSVRINKVLHGTNDRENYLFLSGLLIGNELTALVGCNQAIVLCSTSNVHNLYKQAITDLGLLQQATFIPPDRMSNAYWEGQLKIFDQFIQSDPSNER